MAQTYSSIKEAGNSPSRNLIWNPIQNNNAEWQDNTWSTASSSDSRVFVNLGWNVSSNNLGSGSISNQATNTDGENTVPGAQVGAHKLRNNQQVALSADSHLAYHTGFSYNDVFTQDSTFGSPLASEMQLSFWTSSNVTGTYIVELSTNTNYNDDMESKRGGCSQSYTINSANTWEYKTVTFPSLPTSYITSEGNRSSFFILTFWLAAGTNYTSGTLNTSWTDLIDNNGSNVWTGRAVGQTNFAASSSDEWLLSSPQLECSSIVTPFSVAPHKKYQSISTSCIKSDNRMPWPGGIMGDFSSATNCYLVNPFGSLGTGNFNLGYQQTSQANFLTRTKNIADITNFSLGNNRVFKSESGDTQSFATTVNNFSRTQLRLGSLSPGIARAGMLALFDQNKLYSGYFFELNE